MRLPKHFVQRQGMSIKVRIQFAEQGSQPRSVIIWRRIF